MKHSLCKLKPALNYVYVTKTDAMYFANNSTTDTKMADHYKLYSMYLFTGFDDDSKFIVPRDSNYFTRRSLYSPLKKKYFS